MALIIPDGFGLLALHITLVGDPEPMVTTLGLGGPDLADNALAQALYTDTQSQVLDMLTEDYTYDGLTITTPTAIAEYMPGPVEGAAGPPSLPQNCAYLVKKSTGQRGRSKQGRMYWPGPQEEAVDQRGYLNGGALTGVQATMDDFLENLQLVDGIANAYLLHSSPSETPDIVTQLIVQPQIATQRRRMR